MAYCLIIGFFSSYFTLAQDQKVADSLRELYPLDDLEDSVRFELLRSLAFNEINDFNLAQSYAEELILLAQTQNNLDYQAHGYFQKGNILKILGDLDEALDAYLKSILIVKQAPNDKSIEASAYGAMGDIYSLSNNHSNAMIYYQKAIYMLRQAKDSIPLASAILNAGDEYLINGDYDSALFYFTESGDIFQKINYPIGKAYNLGNIGMVYANMGKNDLAEQNINEAINILERAQDYYPVCFYLISISDIYLEKDNLPVSLNYAIRSLELAEQYKLKQPVSDASLKLSELYEKSGEHQLSLWHFKNYVIYRDSVNNLETFQNIADQRTEFEVNLREKEIDLLEKDQALNRTYIVVAIILLLLSIAVLLYFRQRFRHTTLLAITERKEHDTNIKDLLRSQETKALQSMVRGKEEERRHLAKELHNHLGSLLATVKVNLNSLDHQDTPKHQRIIGLVDQACQDIRNISHELNMGISENFGLVPALKELVAHLSESREISVELISSLENVHIDSNNEIMVYRIVQELVSNVLKHAQATKLSILLTGFEEEGIVNILVHDNGRGFNKSDIDNKGSKGIGLGSLKEMVQKLDGEIGIDSSAKGGTTVSIDLPIFSSEIKIDEL